MFSMFSTGVFVGGFTIEGRWNCHGSRDHRLIHSGLLYSSKSPVIISNFITCDYLSEQHIARNYSVVFTRYPKDELNWWVTVVELMCTLSPYIVIIAIALCVATFFRFTDIVVYICSFRLLESLQRRFINSSHDRFFISIAFKTLIQISLCDC